jgi:hypothetical protein
MLKATFASLLLSLTLIGSLNGAGLKPESYYHEIAAKALEGEMEITMPDRAICDIVTEEYAIEVKKHPDWKDAIGQSLNYAIQSNKKAGILLILEKESDESHLIRVNSIVGHYKLPIDVLAIRAWE